VEGKKNGLVKMTLTGQVFAILSGVASDKQVGKIYKAVKKYLQDKKLGGFRLNTDFKTLQPELGRAFSFSYGDKENGAIFSHMCVMFSYALYARSFAKEGFEVLDSLYKLAANSSTSKIYPNLAEYFNLDGCGMYSYLTGSASWFVMTLLTQSFGIKAELGDIIIAPKLVEGQFKSSPRISVQLKLSGKSVKISYLNPHKKEYPNYKVKTDTPCQRLSDKGILIKRSFFASSPSKQININITLD
jgi:cellobiose phosphorylase